jgi:glycerol uptake facilitator protein
MFTFLELSSSELFSTVFIPEIIGTFLLILMGAGVNMSTSLRKSKGFGGGWIVVSWGWGIAVMIGVFAAWSSGGHLNPAVTIGKTIAHGFNPDVELAPGIPVSALAVVLYICAQMIGAVLGACAAWLAYKQLMDDEPDQGTKLGVFATGPAIRNYKWNLVTEIIATFVLVYWVLVSGYTETAIGPVGVALLIVGIGMSLGSPTGYAINPARDLGPRIAHAILPIQGKGSSDWAYSWVPIVGPILGAVVAAALYGVFPMTDLTAMLTG